MTDRPPAPGRLARSPRNWPLRPLRGARLGPAAADLRRRAARAHRGRGQAGAGPPVGQLVRPRRQPRRAPRPAVRRDARRHRARGLAGRGRAARRRPGRLPPPGRAAVPGRGRLRRPRLPLARAAGERAAAAGTADGARCPATTTASWPGCGSTRPAPSRRSPTPGDPGPAAPVADRARRRYAGRRVRTGGHRGQPARPVARRVVSPVLLPLAVGAVRAGRGG